MQGTHQVAAVLLQRGQGQQRIELPRLQAQRLPQVQRPGAPVPQRRLGLAAQGADRVSAAALAVKEAPREP